MEIVRKLTNPMTDPMISCELNISDPNDRDRMARSLRKQSLTPLMVLNTCQRLETYGRMRPCLDNPKLICDTQDEETSIRKLARIACGLESRIIGELEIMGQVREAYKEFHQKFGQDDPRLDRLFQKAIALARKARRESGIDQNLTGLSALTARRIIDSVSEDATVTIVGSGSIAKGVARYLGKRSKLPVRVSSRCPENAMKLAMEFGGFSSGLDELKPMLRDARVIVTATAAPHPLVYNSHVPATLDSRLIIDLGEPPDCADEIHIRDDIEYIGLLDMEAHAETNTEERVRRANLAEEIIKTAVL
jgi:glutamyl-tRNA reductase